MTTWIGWVILAAAAALLLLLLLLLRLKVGFRAVFGKSVKLWVKIGPGMFLLYPRKNQEKAADEKKQEKKVRKKKKEKEKRQITFQAVQELLSALLPVGLDAMERVRKGLYIRCFKLYLTVSNRDPAEAARRYGRVNTVLWPLLAAVENVVTVERQDVRVSLDYTQWHTSAEGEVFITMRLWHGFAVLLTDGLRAVKPLLRFWKQTKPVKTKDNKKQEKKQMPKDAAEDAA